MPCKANGLTLAFNLKTGEERWFTLPPEQAVVAAYASEHGDGNTWEYTNKKYPVVTGQYSVACGDWASTLSARTIGYDRDVALITSQVRRWQGRGTCGNRGLCECESSVHIGTQTQFKVCNTCSKRVCKDCARQQCCHE